MQIWAEAKELWKQGEKLWPEGDLLRAAEEAARDAMEADDRIGTVGEYLDTLLPENWSRMDLYERRNFLADRKDPMMPKGTVQRTRVSNMEIWSECFGRDPSDLKPADSYSIAALMVRFPDWKRTERVLKLPMYGRQRVYERRVTEPDFLK